MKNRTLLLILLAVGFIGITSCGQDNSQEQQLQAENMALQQQLMAQRGSASSVVTMTQVATAIANVTVTSTGGTTSTSTSGTTVVYTITSNSTGTAIRQ